MFTEGLNTVLIVFFTKVIGYKLKLLRDNVRLYAAGKGLQCCYHEIKREDALVLESNVDDVYK